MLVQLNLIYSEVSPYTCPELIMVPLATNSSEGGSPVTITRLVSTVHIVAEVGVRVWDAADTWHVTRGTWQLVRCVTDQQGTFVCGARLPQIMHKAGGASRRHCSTAALQHSARAVLASHVCCVSTALPRNGEPASIIRHPTIVLLWETAESYIWLRTAIYVSKGTFAVFIKFCLALIINYSCCMECPLSTVPDFSLGDWAGG